ncbi:hypothetical protein ACQCN2_08200 [Brevibacillus ginsengisoli]|uniref:hypothetical protein n=1 Tax=Brevibacillus ginsengisoli TaxID=363854 RepID=UPI003CEF1211
MEMNMGNHMETKEIPHVDIPDEFTQVDRPEVEITTPHPQPTNPQVASSTSGLSTVDQEEQTAEMIGFTRS